MTDADTNPTVGPYATAAPTYWAAGWRGILPLPAGAKTPVPRGYTGTGGTWPSYPDIQAWTEDRGHGNIALRLPPDVLGVDVDHYGNKPGGAVLASLEQALGPLPATWRTTSRDDGVSGIRLYRIPAGLRWPGVLGPGIETIRHEHRYAVAWPSIHPAGGTYRWITPDGATALGVVPTIDDLPDLPDAWVQHFTKGELATDQAHADLSAAAAGTWLGDRGNGTPCRHMARALGRGLTDLTTATSRHDTTLQLTNRLVWLAGEGHTGSTTALLQAQGAFLRAVAGDRGEQDARDEWDRMVAGAVRIAAAAHPEPSTDPCQHPLVGLLPPRQDQPWTSPAASGAPSAAPSTPASATVTAAVPTATGVSPEPTTGTVSDAEPAERPRTSWWPRNLEPAITGENPEPPPAFLRRDDDQALFYPAKVNGLIGPSESGKTWIALEAVRQAVLDEQAVTILDFEDSDTGIVTRLSTIGLTGDQIRDHVAYIGPDQMLGMPEQADLLEHLQLHQPALIILDGVNAAMTLLGLDLNSNTDATRFAQLVLKPLAATGAAVAYIDHTPKDSENKSAGGIGAQAKRAMTTGCAIRVEVIKAFGKGQEGKLRLRVDKDRPGYVRGNSLPGKAGHWAADAHLVPGPDDSLTVTLTAPQQRQEASEQAASTFRPTTLMQRVSAFLDTVPDGASLRGILDGVTGNEKGIRTAVDVLVTEGYVTRESATGRGGARLIHRHVKAYTELSDLVPDASVATVATSVANRRQGDASSVANESVAPSPSPYGETETLRADTGRPATGHGPRSAAKPEWIHRVVGGEQVEVNTTTGEIREAGSAS